MGIRKVKNNRELISEISDELVKYYTVFDSMYKPIECEMEYPKSNDIISLESYLHIHKFFKESGVPVMDFKRAHKNSLYFKLYGGYKTLYSKLNSLVVTSEKLYSTYISVINTTWYYLSKSDYPTHLKNYFDFTLDVHLNYFITLLEKITGKTLSSEVVDSIKSEFSFLLDIVKKMPLRASHGKLTLGNTLSYHDSFMLINYHSALIAPYLYDFTYLVTDMCSKFGDDYEMVFVKDYYELTHTFFKSDIDEWKEGDYFISYKVIQMFILIERTFKILSNQEMNSDYMKFELNTEIRKIRKYTRKYSEFNRLWAIYKTIMEE